MNDRSAKDGSLIPVERIEQSILLIRGQKVMLSPHLADLYTVETRVLNQAVKRNISRFPGDWGMVMAQTSSAGTNTGWLWPCNTSTL